MCGHSPHYYQTFVKRYGFEPARDQNVALEISLDAPALERIQRVAKRIRARKNFRIREANFERWDDEIDGLLILLNRSTEHRVNCGDAQ